MEPESESESESQHTRVHTRAHTHMHGGQDLLDVYGEVNGKATSVRTCAWRCASVCPHVDGNWPPWTYIWLSCISGARESERTIRESVNGDLHTRTHTHTHTNTQSERASARESEREREREGVTWAGIGSVALAVIACVVALAQQHDLVREELVRVAWTVSDSGSD